MKPKNNKEFVKAKKWAIKNLTNTEVYVPLLKANLLFTKEGINHGLYYKQKCG